MPPRTRKAAAEPVAAPPPAAKKVKQTEIPDDPLGYAPDELELEKIAAVMGISSFGTTKNKNHSSSDCFAAIRVPKRKTARMVKPKTAK
jgi:hypothetical protein